jgi:DNA-directed RNA polymerase subunit RPC12/RpoP
MKMKWKKDEHTDNYICPHCGYMVQHNGYGGCDYQSCPDCGRKVEPVRGEQDESKN